MWQDNINKHKVDQQLPQWLRSGKIMWVGGKTFA
jgi:hypothetical protein